MMNVRAHPAHQRHSRMCVQEGSPLRSSFCTWLRRGCGRRRGRVGAGVGGRQLLYQRKDLRPLPLAHGLERRLAHVLSILWHTPTRREGEREREAHTYTHVHWSAAVDVWAVRPPPVRTSQDRGEVGERRPLEAQHALTMLSELSNKEREGRLG
jgi:hypothetical protein